jgi:hypothetical protein
MLVNCTVNPERVRAIGTMLALAHADRLAVAMDTALGHTAFELWTAQHPHDEARRLTFGEWRFP